MTERCCWFMEEDQWNTWWQTECQGAFEFIEGGPEENNFKFCPYCGRELVLAKQGNPDA